MKILSITCLHDGCVNKMIIDTVETTMVINNINRSDVKKYIRKNLKTKISGDMIEDCINEDDMDKRRVINLIAYIIDAERSFNYKPDWEEWKDRCDFGYNPEWAENNKIPTFMSCIDKDKTAIAESVARTIEDRDIDLYEMDEYLSKVLINMKQTGDETNERIVKLARKLLNPIMFPDDEFSDVIAVECMELLTE